MPSLHFAWALLLWWNSRGLPAWVRALTGCCLSLMVLATLGSGEHYLVDLVVGTPFALAVQAACCHRHSAVHSSAFNEYMARRWQRVVLLLASATVLLWLGLLRFSPALCQADATTSWLIVLATVTVSLVLEQVLARASRGSERAVPRHSWQKLDRTAERA